jgi:hypothetical protein
MNWKWFILPVVAVLLITSFVSLVSTDQTTIEKPINSGSEDGESVPTWQVSEYWSYNVESSVGHTSPSIIELVCYDISDGNYYIGTSSRDHALIHAVYNLNPMLGRQTVSNLDVYENGEPKAMYSFPLNDGSSWQNSLFDRTLSASASYNDRIETAIGVFAGYEITASSEDGFTLEYNYIPAINWFSSFAISEQGEIVYALELVEHGSGYEGDLYFMRASDLLENTLSSANPETFSVNGHPRHGNFDFIAVGFDTDYSPLLWRIEITNPAGNVQYRSNSPSGSITEMPNMNGDWTVQAGMFLPALMFRQPTVDVQIAGVLEYSVTL